MMDDQELKIAELEEEVRQLREAARLAIRWISGGEPRIDSDFIREKLRDAVKFSDESSP